MSFEGGYGYHDWNYPAYEYEPMYEPYSGMWTNQYFSSSQVQESHEDVGYWPSPEYPFEEPQAPTQHDEALIQLMQTYIQLNVQSIERMTTKELTEDVGYWEQPEFSLEEAQPSNQAEDPLIEMMQSYIQASDYQVQLDTQRIEGTTAGLGCIEAQLGQLVVDVDGLVQQGPIEELSKSEVAPSSTNHCEHLELEVVEDILEEQTVEVIEQKEEIVVEDSPNPNQVDSLIFKELNINDEGEKFTHSSLNYNVCSFENFDIVFDKSTHAQDNSIIQGDESSKVVTWSVVEESLSPKEVFKIFVEEEIPAPREKYLSKCLQVDIWEDANPNLLIGCVRIVKVQERLLPEILKARKKAST